MKKKGFTLIELLAVIVILAIIALIATPIVLNIIARSKESATLRGAEYYLDAVEQGIARARLDNVKVEDGTYNILGTGNICLEGEVSSCTEQIQVEVKGEIPNLGTITITAGKIDEVELTYGDKSVVKDNDKLIFVNKEIEKKLLKQAEDYIKAVEDAAKAHLESDSTLISFLPAVGDAEIQTDGNVLSWASYRVSSDEFDVKTVLISVTSNVSKPKAGSINIYGSKVVRVNLLEFDEGKIRSIDKNENGEIDDGELVVID